MSQIIEKIFLNELNDEFKHRVKIFYVFQDYPSFNVLIVTKDDKTFALGKNSFNQLGFGHAEVVNKIQIVKELCGKQIIDFANGLEHCIARNSSGKVYCWGLNDRGLLGIGFQDLRIYKPILNHYLNNEFVIDISCGGHHSLVLTNCGEVYAWGYRGQIGNGWNEWKEWYQLKPNKVKGFKNERVVMISCGRWHSMALTECGHVYSWGWNNCGQLGIGNTVDSNEPKFVAVIDDNKCNVFIEKISCGRFHSLLLSSDGNIYAFGSNEFGELGNQKEENELSPHRIKIETKFIDISSHWISSISIALSQNGIYYNWGQCGEERIRTPKPTNFESFVEIYTKYLKITNKAINFEEQNSIPTLNAINFEQNSTPILSKNKFLNKAISLFFKNSDPILLRDKYVKEFSEQNLISSGSFGFVSKVMHKNSRKIYAIKRIALNKEESEKAFKELKLMKKLKSCYVLEYIDSWIEENTSEFKPQSSSKTSSSNSILDPRKPILLHIQMDFCCETLNDVIKHFSNELTENSSEMMKTLFYYICCELLSEIIECVHYLHKCNIIYRDLKPKNIFITDGINGRFVKLANPVFNHQTVTQCSEVMT
jgi:alpha-tubulin suppressor-like RCC1 family protein